MIVCPQCRQANPEEAQFCSRCGRSLEPGPTFMGPARQTEGRLPIEIKTPQPPSRWRPVILLAAALGIVVGFAAWKLLGPDPCRGRNFTSERFGYCLTIPEGWSAGTAQVGNTALDQFSVPTEPTTVLVEAVDLSADTNLAQFAEFVRQKDGEAGLTAGPIRAVTLGGMDAESWDISLASAAGDAFQVREVVVVKDEVGWRITLNDSAEGFHDHARSFQQMLDSWRFA